MVSEYKEDFELPSRGYLYDDIPNTIILRAMKAKEEKMLLGSKGSRVFTNIISACIVKPSPINMGNLIMPDKYFLLMKLRILSYGNEYYAQYKCTNPNCGETSEFKINLDELDINYLDEDFEEPFEMELPCGDVIGMRFLRDRDTRKIERRAKKIRKQAKNKQKVGNIEYILRLKRRLVTVNGEEIEPNRKRKYIEDLGTRDTSYIRWYLNNECELGYDLDIFEECPYCFKDLEFTLPITEEFFRTRFDHAEREGI